MTTTRPQPEKSPRTRKVRRWTPEEDALLRQEYDGSLRVRERLASRLGRTLASVKNHASYIGLSFHNKEPLWSDKEIHFLEMSYDKLSLNDIAKRLKRTPNAVRIQLRRLSLSRRYRDGWYTREEVAAILGIDHKRIQTFIDCGALKARRHNPEGGVGSYWHIDAKDLRAFLIKYCAQLKGRNVDLMALVHVLTDYGDD